MVNFNNIIESYNTYRGTNYVAVKTSKPTSNPFAKGQLEFKIKLVDSITGKEVYTVSQFMYTSEKVPQDVWWPLYKKVLKFLFTNEGI